MRLKKTVIKLLNNLEIIYKINIWRIYTVAIMIESIDKIARNKQRDVLFIGFSMECRHKDCEIRQSLIKWLDENNIPYSYCARFRDENYFDSYARDLYIDIIFDENNPIYKLLEEHLENEDGSFKIDGTGFYYLTLDEAMKNLHHDEPDYFDKLDKELGEW